MLSLVKISDVFNIEKGSLQSSKSTPGEYDFITASAEWKTHNDYSHDCEALIFAMAASGSLGRTHYVNGKFITSDLCFILTPKSGFESNIDIMFYYYYFNSIRSKLVKETATGTSKLSINQTNFLNYKVIFGGIKDQEKLRRIYENVDKYSSELIVKIAKQEKYVSRLRQTILQMAVEGKLVPQDENDEPASVLLEKIHIEKDRHVKEGKIKKEKSLSPISFGEKPFNLPKGWEWCRLSTIITDCDYGTSEKATEIQLNGYIPVLRMNNIISNGQISFSNLKYLSAIIPDLPRLLLQHGDLLFNRTNSYELVGKTGLYSKSNEDFTFASYLIRIRPLAINNNYLHYYMNTTSYRSTQIEPFITQQNGQANYNGTKLKSTLVALPPLAEQQRIVKKVDILMSLCDQLEKNIISSKEASALLMQAVLNKAFTFNAKKIIEFPAYDNEYIEDWDIAARTYGDIKPETQIKIATRLAELSKVMK